MRMWHIAVVMILTCTLGCASLESMFENEKEIPLSEVPSQAVEAAKGTVEGITLTEAEVEEENGQTVYDLEGIANGIEYKIEVTADGEVLEVEKEGEEEQDDD